MTKPSGVAINQRGEVVVTEYEAHCVSVFSPSGKKLRSFGTRGSGQGQFESPRGITVDGDGNILVADSNNHRIQKFTAEGQFLAAVGKTGGGWLQFVEPYGITFNTINNKIYVTNKNHHVQLTSPTQVPLGSKAVVRDSLTIHVVLPVTVLGMCMLEIYGNIAFKSSQQKGSS